MNKLNRQQVLQLEDGAQVHVKLTRLYWPQPVVTYEGPAHLYVQNHNGVAVVLTVRDPLVWAEADPRCDVDSDGSVIVEDYKLEIFGP
jgi:hypothetical protein